jgi:diguanylate cyclase (GGDEF)-like protein
MGKYVILVQCDPESDLAKFICESIEGIPDVGLEFVEDPGDSQAKLSPDYYALVVNVLPEGPQAELDDLLNFSLGGESPVPVLYILADAQEGDRLIAVCKPGEKRLIDILYIPVTRSALENKIQLLLELHRLKEKVRVYKQDAEEKSLELEVLQQELLEKNYRLELLTSLDSLTGLFNRYYFDENLQKEWKQAVRQEEPLSLLFINVDYLKLYNEHYGRLAGDEVMRDLAMVLHQSLLRPVDVVARYAGDQFAVTLPSTNRAGAQLVANRMLEHVDALKREHLASPVSDQLTISVGGATVRPQHTQNIGALMDKAEQALEEAKQAGRNGSCCR